MSSAFIALQKNWHIVCESCKTPIARVRRDIHLGEILLSQDFESEGGYVGAGAKMECHRCHTPYFRASDGKIFTLEKGWQP